MTSTIRSTVKAHGSVLPPNQLYAYLYQPVSSQAPVDSPFFAVPSEALALVLVLVLVLVSPGRLHLICVRILAPVQVWLTLWHVKRSQCALEVGSVQQVLESRYLRKEITGAVKLSKEYIINLWNLSIIYITIYSFNIL